MANLIISDASYKVSGKTVVVNYTTDVVLTNVQLSKDGVNFIDSSGFSQLGAMFDISTWENGFYENCILRGYYDDINIIFDITSIMVNERETAKLSLFLDKEPVEDSMTLNVKSENTNVATVNKTSLIFTKENFNMPQEIMVTGIYNSDDRDYITDILFLNNDAKISSMQVFVKNIDIFYGEIIINKTSISIDENTSTTFNVKLNKKPTNNQIVRINCNNNNLTLDKKQLTFTPDNYNVEQVVTMTSGYNEDVSNRTSIITLSSDNVSNVTSNVTINNIDVYGEIVLNKTSISINEGETNTFTVRLNERPFKNQIIYIETNNNYATLNKTSLTFTPDNYNIEQVVTINTTHEDEYYSDRNCILTLSSPNVSNKEVNVTVVNTDEIPIMIYGEIVLNKTSISINESGTDTFTVKLNEKPTQEQIVTLSLNNNYATLNKTSLTFTPSNYNTTQTVTVTGVHDSSNYDNRNCILTLSSPNVSNKTINITVNNIDEIPIVYGEIVLNKTNLSVNEGSTTTFTIKLDKEPTNNQIVTLSTTNSNVTLNKTSLTFTPSNYNTTQTVTVTGVRDTSSYVNKTSTINISSTNVTPKTISVTVNNIDKKSYTITKEITNCTISNTATNIEEGSSYTANLTPNSGYNMESLSVYMDGVDITSNAVTQWNINITNVTGNITIIANATKKIYPTFEAGYVDSDGHIIDDLEFIYTYPLIAVNGYKEATIMVTGSYSYLIGYITVYDSSLDLIEQVYVSDPSYTYKIPSNAENLVFDIYTPNGAYDAIADISAVITLS